MTPDRNQLVLDANLLDKAIAYFEHKGYDTSDAYVLQAAKLYRQQLTAQPVTDDEVREAIKWLQRNFDGIPLSVRLRIDVLYRAATAPKCDHEHLISLAERSAKQRLELQDKCDALVKALEEIRDGMPMSPDDYYEGHYHEYRLIAEQALAAHRAQQEGK